MSGDGESRLSIDYRLIFDATSNAMAFSAASSGRIIDVNETWVRTTGIPREEAIGRTAFDLGIWVNEAERAACLAELNRKGFVRNYEVRLRLRGEDMPHLISGRFVEVGDDRRVLWEFLDIGERVRVEEAQRSAAAWHRALLQSTVEGICILDEKKQVIEVNDRFAAMLGYPPEALIGKQPWDWDADFSQAELEQRFPTAYPAVYTLETRHRRHDGSLYDAEVSVHHVEIGSRRVVVSVVRDISARKEIERRLQAAYATLESERTFLKTLVQTIPDLVWLKDGEGAYLACNHEFERFFGHSEQEIIGKHDFDFMPRELADFFRGHDLKAISAGKPTTNEEWITYASDGHRALLMTTKTPMNRADGSLIGVLGIAHDIAALRRNEAALRDSQEALNRAQSVAKVGSWHLDIATNVVTWSDETYRLFGLPPGAPLCLKEFADRLHPDDRKAAKRCWNAAAAGQPYTIEYRVLPGDGTIRWILERTEIQRDAEGRALAGVGIIQDITDRKRAELEVALYRQDLEAQVQQRTQDLQATHRKLLDIQFAMDKVGIGIIWADVGTARITYANDFAARQLGYPMDELLELTVGDIDPNFPLDQFHQICGQIKAHGHLQFETENRTRDGRMIPMQVSIDYHEGSDDSPPRLIAFVTDIARRKDTEAALVGAMQAAEAANRRLSLSDRRLSAMFAMSQRVHELDEDQLLQMGIDEAVRLTGSEIGYLHLVNEDQETLNLKTWSTGTLRHCTATYDSHYPVSAAGVWADSVRLLKPVVHNDYQTLAERRGVPAGHAHLVRHIGVPVVENGRARLLLGVGNKPTEYDDSDIEQLQLIGNDLWAIVVRRRAETALAAAKSAAEAANVAKSAFLANMSHEIRTPLNAITGMAYLIRRSGLTAEQSKRMDTLVASSEHLLGIINAILDLSKIEAGKFVLEETSLRVDALLGNVSAILRERAEAKHLALHCETDPMPPSLRGDPVRLQQALLNYTANAIKFTDTGSITLRARIIDESAHHALIRFEVEDTGIGVPPEALARLFSSFEQADNSITRKYGGTGLGLAITRRIAELAGGEAGAESMPGKGSTFWFTARLAKGEVTSLASVPLPVAGSTEELLRRDFAGTHLLLAEDDPVNQEITLMLLEEVGLTADVASDGLRAVELATQNDYALILMDMQMPRLDGLAAIRRIRELPNGDKTPIVALTANAFSEDKQRCLEAGANDFVAKPVDPELLFASLLAWLASGRG